MNVLSTGGAPFGRRVSTASHHCEVLHPLLARASRRCRPRSAGDMRPGTSEEVLETVISVAGTCSMRNLELFVTLITSNKIRTRSFGSAAVEGTCVCASAPADDDGFNNCRDRTLKRLLRYGMIRVF
eukprot:1194280-Prorocentrum_minimum.AAC.6